MVSLLNFGYNIVFSYNSLNFLPVLRIFKSRFGKAGDLQEIPDPGVHFIQIIHHLEASVSLQYFKVQLPVQYRIPYNSIAFVNWTLLVNHIRPNLITFSL